MKTPAQELFIESTRKVDTPTRRRSNEYTQPLKTFGWRLSAVLVAVVAAGSTVLESVPIAAGMTVAALVPAALFDIDHRRLPDVLVAPAAVMFSVCHLWSIAVGGAPGWITIGSGAIALAGPLLALHLVSPVAMGFGDVKVAAVLGAAVGTVDWQLGIVTLALATGATATVGLLRRVPTLPLGPGLVASATIALAANTLFLSPSGVGR